MQWSQLKKRFENTFADSVQGRIEIWATRYRHSHDQAGECWVTLDKNKIINMADLTYYNAYYGEAHRIRQETSCLDYTDPNEAAGYYQAYDQAKHQAVNNSIFHSGELVMAMEEYLTISIDDALSSPNPLLQAFAMLDRRFGKRRLSAFEQQEKHPLQQKFYQLRCFLDSFNHAATQKTEGTDFFAERARL